HEREIVAAELFLAELRGAPPRVGSYPHDDVAVGRAVLDDRVTELGLEPREELRRGLVERVGRYDARFGRVGLGRFDRRLGLLVSQRPSAPAASRSSAR